MATAFVRDRRPAALTPSLQALACAAMWEVTRHAERRRALLAAIDEAQVEARAVTEAPILSARVRGCQRQVLLRRGWRRRLGATWVQIGERLWLHPEAGVVSEEHTCEVSDHRVTNMRIAWSDDYARAWQMSWWARAMAGIGLDERAPYETTLGSMAATMRRELRADGRWRLAVRRASAPSWVYEVTPEPNDADQLRELRRMGVEGSALEAGLAVFDGGAPAPMHDFNSSASAAETPDCVTTRRKMV